MTVCGITAEYNPFHSGHAYQCARIRESLPGCAVISVMSGNYVQRGDFAVWEKYQRAAYAVRSGGPDLILELSLPAALGSAERFAAGAVTQLLACGCLTHLSFGSESGDADRLRRAAELSRSAEYTALLQSLMSGGLGYAAASQAALEHLDAECGALLSGPNDLLGIQYLRALGSSPVGILPVLREGTGHDGEPAGSHPSASWLRKQLAQGADVRAWLSPDAADYPRQTAAGHDRELLYTLRRLTLSQWAETAGVSEGLENRLYRAARECGSAAEIVSAVSSRRYPLSRIRRILLCADLGITKADASVPPQYLRVLAFNETGRSVLREMKQTASLPVITKPVAASSLTGDARRIWELDMNADDHYLFPLPAGSGWKRTPSFVRTTE